MPRKYRREKRRTVQALTWSDLDIPGQLDMWSSWSPGEFSEQTKRYTTWREYLEVWEQVREERIESTDSGSVDGHYAEKIRRGVLAGESAENVAAQISRDGDESYYREMYQEDAEHGQTEGTEDEFVEDMTRSDAEACETYRNSHLTTQTKDI